MYLYIFFVLITLILGCKSFKGGMNDVYFTMHGIYFSKLKVTNHKEVLLSVEQLLNRGIEAVKLNPPTYKHSTDSK